MTGITLYDAYFPTLTKSVDSLEAILVKAQAHAAENGINVDTEYAPARIHETMEPLTFQILVVAKMIQNVVKLANGTPVEPWNKDEVTFEQMLSRVQKTRELLKTVTPEDINSKQGQESDVQIGGQTKKMVPEAYIPYFCVSNTFFHLQTAYTILRMKGVPLGKGDFLGPFLA